MTIVTLEKEGNSYILIAKGHANTDNSKDGGAVCNAVSILLQSLIQCLNDAGFKQQDAKAGNVTIKIPIDNTEINHYLCFALTGLMLLEHKYPQYIKVSTPFG